MILERDIEISDLIVGKKIVLYTPNEKGEMPNAAIKQFVPSSVNISLDRWFVGYTPEIINGFNMIEIPTEIAYGLQYFNIIDGTTKKYNMVGTINEDATKKLITLTEEQKALQIKAKKFVMILELNRKLDTKMVTYFNGFSGVEKSTWDLQLSEAMAYKNNTNSSSTVLNTMAEIRGITVDELADKVIQKATEYQLKVAKLIAEKQIIETHIQQTITDDELNTILFGELLDY